MDTTLTSWNDILNIFFLPMCMSQLVSIVKLYRAMYSMHQGHCLLSRFSGFWQLCSQVKLVMVNGMMGVAFDL